MMIKLNAISEYHDELNMNHHDYNGETPRDELQHHIEQNIDFIENEEEALQKLIASEPQQ